MIEKIFYMKPIKRTITVWVIFFLIQWITFGAGYFTHKEAWNSVEITVADTGINSAILIFINNFILVSLIILGNIFARFGRVSIGGVILLIQGVIIGWTAGTNSFLFPFESLKEANINYFKIGLWELSAYAIICGVTITKSLYISETFPPKKWISEKKIKDIKFNTTEIILLLTGFVLLVGSALVEGFFI